VLDGENGAFAVARGLWVEEVRVPVLAGPAAFAFGAEERGDAGERGGELEAESGADVRELAWGLHGVRRLWGGEERERESEGEQGWIHLRGLWLRAFVCGCSLRS
jgi:hypothetical protein